MWVRVKSWAAKAKRRRLGDLDNRHLSPHSSGGWKSEIKAQQVRFLVRTLPGLQTAAFFQGSQWGAGKGDAGAGRAEAGRAAPPVSPPGFIRAVISWAPLQIHWQLGLQHVNFVGNRPV